MDTTQQHHIHKMDARNKMFSYNKTEITQHITMVLMQYHTYMQNLHFLTPKGPKSQNGFFGSLGRLLQRQKHK
jgi:hypothetical protein